MLLNSKMFRVCRTRSKYNAAWLLPFILLPFTSAAMFEGDACTMKSTPGVCKLASECTELEIAVRSGRFTSSDIVNCGFTTREEIICCPGEDSVSTDNRSDDKLYFEQALTTTTSTTTTEASNTDFREHFLTNTTTTAKPDFWLHLLSSTTTTTTAKPDFWLHLLSTTTTTTSTTTPKPIIINGKKLDTDSGFIDLTALLSQKKLSAKNNEATLKRESVNNDFDSNKNSYSTDDFTLGFQQPPEGIPKPTVDYNIPSPRPWSTDSMRNFKPNPNMPFRADSLNERTGRRQPLWNAAGQNFVMQPAQNLIQENTQILRPGRILNQINPIPNIVPWNERKRENNFNMRQPALWQNNQLEPTDSFNNNFRHNENSKQNRSPWQNNHMGPTDNFVDNFRPNENSQQNRSPWQHNQMGSPDENENNPPNDSTFNHSPIAETNFLPNRPIFPQRNNARTPNNFNNQARDPIKMVNEKLKNSGLDIISAKTDYEQYVDSSAMEGTTTARLPFQFQPQPTKNSNEILINEKVSSKNSNNFRFPGAAVNREIWNSNPSSKRPNDDEVEPKNPTTSTRNNNTISPVTTRGKDRPAVIACRDIDAGLLGGLTQHILGGTPVEMGEFPHMAAIGYSRIGSDRGPYDYRCGGTLIAKRFILTAAHCVNSRDSQPAVALLGLIDLNNEEERQAAQEIPIRRVHIHPEYTSSRTYHDVAILELERDVTYTEFIYPSCLYTGLNDPPKNIPLYVTGWGQTNTSNRKKSTILLKAKLDVVSVSQCNSSYVQMGLNRRIADGILNSQLCAHDPGYTRDACQGDSGGPLNLVVDESTKKYRIVGIISAGFSCASATPGLYARVASYLDYIESVVWPNLS